MTYRDLQNWSYNDDLHHVTDQQRKKVKHGEATPEVMIAGLAIGLYLLVVIALWP